MVRFLHSICDDSTDYILGYHTPDSEADAREEPDCFTDI